MSTIALREITRATTIARLLYAAPAWWGFAHAKDRARVERFISKTGRMGYLPEEFPDAGEMVEVADRLLRLSIVLTMFYDLFPPVISRRPGLRRRQHEFTLPEKDDRNFIPRILYRTLNHHLVYFVNCSSSFTN